MGSTKMQDNVDCFLEKKGHAYFKFTWNWIQTSHIVSEVVLFDNTSGNAPCHLSFTLHKANS